MEEEQIVKEELKGRKKLMRDIRRAEREFSKDFSEGRTRREFQFLTYTEIALIMRVQLETVVRWVSNGDLRKKVKLGRRVLIPIEEVRRFIKERTIVYRKKR